MSHSLNNDYNHSWTVPNPFQVLKPSNYNITGGPSNKTSGKKTAAGTSARLEGSAGYFGTGYFGTEYSGSHPDATALLSFTN